MECWDVYDIERNKTGRTMIRGDKFEEGAYHLVVHICIFNSKGEMLIQRRIPTKDKWPNMWDLTVGGSAVKGETSNEAIERELFEEIGLDLDMKNLRPKLTINFLHGFNDIYIVNNIDVDLEKLKLQAEEVAEVSWATKDEILTMIEENKFIPYYKNYISLLFDIRNDYGCIDKSKVTTNNDK